MKIIWSPLSIERLEQIIDYISKDSIFAAQKLAQNILDKIDNLVDYPEMGRIVPEVNRKEIREIFEGEYRIIYKIQKSQIEILTIRNFKQQLPEDDITRAKDF